MAHVVKVPTPAFEVGGLVVHQVPAATDNLVWVVQCAATGEAAIVDGPDAEVVTWAAEHGIDPKTILTTHTHGDHIGLHRALAADGRLSRFRVVGPNLDEIPGLSEIVREGSPVRLGEVTGRVIETPGHLDGHVSYVFDGVVFCGDTMFAAGCGVPFSGPPEALFRSLLRLAELPADTRVCCAHEYTWDNLRFAWMLEPDNEALADRIRATRPILEAGGSAVPSTIDLERATNPFLRPGARTLVARVREAMPDADLSTPAAVFAAARALKTRKDHRAIPESTLP